MDKENAQKLLFEVADILESVELPFMLYGGTCLGAYREDKFIDCDEDVDFACLHEEFLPLAKELAEKFTNAGFEVHIVDHRHEREWDGTIYGLKLSKYGINSDLFGWFNHHDKRFTFSHYGDFILAHDAKYFHMNKDLRFYGRVFRVPEDTEGFLTEKYGDWKIPHKEFNNVCKPTCRYSGDDFWSL